MSWGKTPSGIAGAALALSVMLARGAHQASAEEKAQATIAEAQEVAPTANRYDLEPIPLTANGPVVESRNNKLVRIRGAAPDGQPRHFEVFFGPSPAENAAKMNGKGRFRNSDPTWECIQGYAFMRGIRPSGSTQYVKATSDSTTIIILVNEAAGEERVIVTEARSGAKVWLTRGDAPPEPNISEGQVIIARVADGVARLDPPKPIAEDAVSVELIGYLKGLKGPLDAGAK